MSVPESIWRKNLTVCWFGMFVSSIGMSQIAPVMPLYIKQLGVQSTAAIEQFSGFAFGITFIMLAIFSPIWGKAADEYGRKPMLLRASLGMAIVLFSMGFVRNVYQLMVLRLIMGTVAGYAVACTTLIATQVDKKQVGYALGTLATSTISGSLLGPMVGGYIAENFRLPDVFFFTGVMLFIAFVTTALFVEEKFERPKGSALKTRAMWEIIPNKSLVITMFITFFMLSLALFSIEPIVTVYISQLTRNAQHVALLSGLAFSASGLASIIATPRVGRLADKIGAHKIMPVSLVLAGIVFIPQAFVKTPVQLIVMRFILGLAAAGLGPSINSLIKKITPDAIAGRVYGFNMAAGYLGISGGAVLGGQIAAHFGIRDVFFVTSSLLLLNALWVYFKVYKKLNGQPLTVEENLNIEESMIVERPTSCV